MGAEKVCLRPITAADTAKIIHWRNKDFVRKNFIYQKLFTEETHTTWFREQVEPGHVAQFIICVLAEGESSLETDDSVWRACRQNKDKDTEKACLSDGMKDAACREIGSVYLRDIDREAGTAEYGVFIGEEKALGKGYGTEAAKLMLAYGFEKLGLQKIYLRLLEDNAGARKSYEKAGFRTIETRRETVCLEQGKRTVFFMETRRDSWENAKRFGME